MRQGSCYLGDGRCTFTVWAPLRENVEVHIVAPDERLLPMARDDEGYWHATADGVPPETRYLYRLDGSIERPDPASRFQPDGVHAPSQVVDHRAFRWHDASWRGRPLSELVFYEIHVGTFTPEGTFAAIIDRLPYLMELGITAVELMPIAQFPGTRNWGYDGVYPYAVQASYGGPAGFAALVDACHACGIAVFLDVVYNHLGPEGNYLRDFGPYLTPRYQTPWGDAINFDGAYSDQVRRYFINNALQWVEEYHVDGLRLDAVHAIFDFSARPFLADLAEEVHRQAAVVGRPVYLIAENDLNDTRLVRSPECGGLGLDAVWADDFHHALHTLLTGEKDGYYGDFGSVGQMAKALREGYVFTGQHSAYRKRRHGNVVTGLVQDNFVVCAQNHDQIGNRLHGERLSALCSFEQLKLAAATVILSPYLPLLFMGEEYGEMAPFRYFVSHSDPDLVEAVRAGRSEEFSDFVGGSAVSDPQSEACFEDSRLTADFHRTGPNTTLFRFYRYLLALRRRSAAFTPDARLNVTVRELPEERVLSVKRWHPPEQMVIILNFSGTRRTIHLPLPLGTWERLLDSSAVEWGGEGDTAPQVLEAAGTVDLDIAPYGVLVYHIHGEVHGKP